MLGYTILMLALGVSALPAPETLPVRPLFTPNTLTTTQDPPFHYIIPRAPTAQHGRCQFLARLTEPLPRTSPVSVNFQIQFFLDGQHNKFTTPQYSNGAGLYTSQPMIDAYLVLNDIIEPQSELRIEWKDYADQNGQLPVMLKQGDKRDYVAFEYTRDGNGTGPIAFAEEYMGKKAWAVCNGTPKWDLNKRRDQRTRRVWCGFDC
jgi:hypothetical protein